jgi:hypothetical protein
MIDNKPFSLQNVSNPRIVCGHAAHCAFLMDDKALIFEQNDKMYRIHQKKQSFDINMKENKPKL